MPIVPQYGLQWEAVLPCVGAMPICRNLRILAAGGDGTVTWLLKTIRDLQVGCMRQECQPPC